MEQMVQVARHALPHLSASNVVSTDLLMSISNVTVANSIWQGEQALVDKDWIEFSALVAAWKRETGLSSSIRRKLSSAHYQKIISMGSRAVPLIIRQIKSEGATPYHWWDALRELTEHDPVPPEVGGDIREVARIWIEWWARRQDAGKLGSK